MEKHRTSNDHTQIRRQHRRANRRWRGEVRTPHRHAMPRPPALPALTAPRAATPSHALARLLWHLRRLGFRCDLAGFLPGVITTIAPPLVRPSLDHRPAALPACPTVTPTNSLCFPPRANAASQGVSPRRTRARKTLLVKR